MSKRLFTPNRTHASTVAAALHVHRRMHEGVVRVRSGVVLGVVGQLVDVEVDILPKLPGVTVVGLAAPAVKEAKERVRSAVRNAGFEFPNRRVTVNLAPARIRKSGTKFDLPIATGVLAAAGEISRDRLDDYVLLGELSLTGQLRPVPGVLPIADSVARLGLTGLVLPTDNAREAALIPGIHVVGVSTLAEAIDFLNGRLEVKDVEAPLAPAFAPAGVDLTSLAGLDSAKRAAEIAAAGAHNLLLVGPPGGGKTLLARAIPGILPLPSHAEALEITRIYSVAGLVSPGEGLQVHRPLRAPHHTVSYAGLVGGGRPIRPGEVSLSHRGVLFLDELPEMEAKALEALREPLEEQRISVVRVDDRVDYPADFMLVASMNPCPCGQPHCECSLETVRRYQSRVSGPLLDRIDLSVYVVPVSWKQLNGGARGERSEEVRARVTEARERQARRYLAEEWDTNGRVPGYAVSKFVKLDRDAERVLEAIDVRGLSARGYHRLLKVARTVADLKGSERVGEGHLLEALSYRFGKERGTEASAIASVPSSRRVI